jgi:hypothetical protein
MTSDFHEEFAQETRRLIQRRFLWFTGVLGSLGVIRFALLLVIPAINHWNAGDTGPRMTLLSDLGRMSATLTVTAIVTSACWACHFAARRERSAETALLQLAFWLTVLEAGSHLVLRAMGAPGALGPVGALMTHVIACACLPWTVVQAVRPVLAIAAVQLAADLLFRKAGIDAKIGFALVALLMGVPGVVLCWLRYSRRVELFKISFFQQRYGEMRRELTDARKIHESLFPPPVSDGPVQFDYRYRPMRQIGGDYLYALFSRPEQGEGKRLNLVVMDVTGHGIPAALTVNRLHGELNRLFAEDPYIAPGEVLRLLNRYVYLTLADHSVFCTALCVRIDPVAGKLEYASGGHPPAFLRAVDGTLHELSSTSFILGACPDNEFHPAQAETRFGPGDALIAYTDGAIEARDHVGAQFGIAGIRRILCSPRPSKAGWAEALIQAVDAHRYGQVLDDTLVIEVYRRLSTGETNMPVAVQRGLSRYGIKVDSTVLVPSSGASGSGGAGSPTRPPPQSSPPRTT